MKILLKWLLIQFINTKYPHPWSSCNKIILPYGYRNSNYRPKTVWWPSQVSNGNPYPDMTVPFSWIEAQIISSQYGDIYLSTQVFPEPLLITAWMRSSGWKILFPFQDIRTLLSTGYEGRIILRSRRWAALIILSHNISHKICIWFCVSLCYCFTLCFVISSVLIPVIITLLL